MDHEAQPDSGGSCSLDETLERLNDAKHPTPGSDKWEGIDTPGHCEKSEDTKITEITSAPLLSSDSGNVQQELEVSNHWEICLDGSSANQGVTGQPCDESAGASIEAGDNIVNADASNICVASCSETCERANPDLAVPSSGEVIPVDADTPKDNYMTSLSEANVEAKLEIARNFPDVGLVSTDSSNERTEKVTKELAADKLEEETCSLPVNIDKSLESEDKRCETDREYDQEAIINLEIVDNKQAVTGTQSEVNVDKLITNDPTVSSETGDGKVEIENSNKFYDQEIKDEINISTLDFSLKKGSLLYDTEVDKTIDQVSVTVDNDGRLPSRVTASSNDVANICKSASLGSAVVNQFGNPVNTKHSTPKHYKGKKKRGNDIKMDHPHTENEVLSSVVHNREKDGGSSIDSTAGSGWKTKEFNNDPMGTEDANSSGGEDSASSPACSQPSQQRKKIDKNHQLVREIVKIQYDREQYDKEQVERQIQVQQSTGLVHSRSKNPENKESKAKLEEMQRITCDSQSIQKPVNSHSNETESQQKYNARSKKSSFHQTNKVFKEYETKRNVSFPQKEDVLEKGIGRSVRGKQRTISIYRPPVARESVSGTLEERNVSDIADCSYNQSAADVNNSSDGSTGSVSESALPAIEASSLLKDEGKLKVVKSSSGERYVHFVESQTESTVPEMNIKVIFDTQRKFRHIELSESRDGQDSATDYQHNSTVGFRSVRSPVSPHVRQDSVLPTSQVINKRQMQSLPKGNDQFEKVSRSESGFAVDSPKFQDRSREGKGAQLDNSHKSSLAFQKGSNSGVNEDSQRTRFADTSMIGAKTPSSLLQGFSGSSSRNISSHEQSFAQFSSDLLQSMDALSLSVDVKTAMQTLQPNRLETRTDIRGKQKSVGSASSSRKKRESHNRIKESRSPYQTPGENKRGVQGLSIHMADVTAHHNMRSSQSDMSWHAPSPGWQSQMSPLPSKDNIFSSLPVSGKWGDIVDEFPDYNDYSTKRVGEQEDNPISSIQNGFGVPLKQGSSSEKRFSRENSGNKGSKAQDNIFERSRTSASEVVKEIPANGTTVRKSVWERLGPQNDQGSILGPPPKISENWSVSKPSPQVNTQRLNTSSSVLGGIDVGLHGTLEHNVGSVSLDEGLEVVVQAYTNMKQKRSKRELYVPRRGL